MGNKRMDEYLTLQKDKIKAICEALVDICNHECCAYGHGDAVDYAESLLDDLNGEYLITQSAGNEIRQKNYEFIQRPRGRKYKL